MFSLFELFSFLDRKMADCYHNYWIVDHFIYPVFALLIRYIDTLAPDLNTT